MSLDRVERSQFGLCRQTILANAHGYVRMDIITLNPSVRLPQIMAMSPLKGLLFTVD